ncbi:MAG: DUF3828 domain-containing protein [Terracidiphilus sp.]
MPARAQGADAAKQFLVSIYQHYGHHGKGIDLSGPRARSYFDESLIALLDADAKAAGPGEVGVLDGDPICSCQDWDGIYDLKIAVQIGSDGRAHAGVSFALLLRRQGLDRDARALEIALVSQKGQWRIDNIVDRSDAKVPFDLRAELQKEIHDARRKSAGHSKP